MPCRYAKAIEAVGEQLAEAIRQVDIEPVDGLSDNPAGVVLVVYCRECECSHMSTFAPDPQKELGAGRLDEYLSNHRALGALRLAIEQIESESHDEKSSTKTRH